MFDNERPLFIQIAEQIEDEILRGVYPEDTQVPSTNELAAFHRINPATAQKGLQMLTEKGTLYKRRGVGMFVAPGAPQQIRTERQAVFSAKYITPLIAEAHAIGLSADELTRLVAEASATQELQQKGSK